MATKEKSTTPEVSKESQQKSNDDMTFRNNAINRINALQNENARLKDAIGRKRTESQKRRIGNAGSVAGLKTLGSKPSLP